ncbi:TIGR00266 family protein [Lactobacillus sp. ESL0701]|uniref:TIGR00266 family protein n=1 Tax=unclassified Lactobacillus TaxID=2620435 RepID=UPI0023F9356D|nr:MULTISPECIES: TIGR00266 family protein [unclassified Lactobacillus]MDF7669238.1 TIGR00266 family protein [Lactobacillus sp. ESL0703]MDF7672856.1 TIGR00266 family protein [Lactobacillus sp. ESL0701]WEV38774.1 TIGR00266 family protein [Lactobacillus sp. ESL0680]
MEIKIFNKGLSPLVELSLANGETAKIQRGSMAYMQNVKLHAKMNSNDHKGLGGLVRSVARSKVTGESMIINEVKATGDNALVGIAPNTIGAIEELTLAEGHQYRLNTGAFLAADENTGYEAIRQKGLSKAVFGKTGGFFILHTKGTGKLLINGTGNIVKMELTDENNFQIDNDNVLAWEDSLDYKIESASGSFGFMSGEGLVDSFYGHGVVYLQTSNLKELARSVRQFLPAE